MVMIDEVLLGLNIGSILLLLLSIILIVKFRKFEKNQNVKRVLSILSIVILFFIIFIMVNIVQNFNTLLNLQLPISSSIIDMSTKVILMPLTAIFILVAIFGLRE